ncbi:hypothetical protein [Paenibacillus planticolens]|uniref:Uncharacterized protein n=1 Tax=Paenibacillus planticolens TaxID=2654976 RepID=A0ABX2A115_9BACL|nr:hypothetical protein [Paenibacillus planticolens]NOV04834.1 hypothetical protein [Paenibacillus planticolens]
MFRQQSNINFSYFVGQKVTDVPIEPDLSFRIIFESGWLMIECPWRIRQLEVAVGRSDCVSAPNKYSYSTVRQFLEGKKITNVYHFEFISDLIVEFDKDIYLELFHDSSYFEGWQLQGYNDFLLVSLPGGNYSNFEAK